MILLKKPYTPVVFTSAEKTFNIYGKSFARLEAVYLSGNVFNNQTFLNPFSAIPKLSATYPGFYGVKLLSSQYVTNFDNTITITVLSAPTEGYVDIIAQNPAGYGALTNYAIKKSYFDPQDVSTFRPWASGIKVVKNETYDNIIVTIANETLLTIAEKDNIITITEPPQ